MGVHAVSVATNTIITAAPANAVDAILATTGSMGLPYDNAQVLLFWFLTITLGAGATNYNVRLRRGNLATSPLINVNNANNVVASNVVTFAGCYTDLPGVAAGLQYTLTGIVTGGAAGIVVNDLCLVAMAL